VSSVSASSSSVGLAASAALWTKLNKEVVVWKECLVPVAVAVAFAVIAVPVAVRHDNGSIRSCCRRNAGVLRSPPTTANDELVLVDSAALIELEIGVFVAHRNIKRDEFAMVQIFIVVVVAFGGTSFTLEFKWSFFDDFLFPSLL